jgi:hypothetical protein
MQNIPIQQKLKNLGEGGCYFLSLLELARRLRDSPVDVLATYDVAVRRSWMNPDCYMNHPEKLLGYLTHRTFSLAKVIASYTASADEYEIIHWRWDGPKGSQWHFTLADYDPFGESFTRLKGYVSSKRILKQL